MGAGRKAAKAIHEYLLGPQAATVQLAETTPAPA
jgi:hypothetical protein